MPDDEWWHGSREPLLEIRPFLHLGSLAQAQMRGGRGCVLTRVEILPGRTLRRRDTGSWKEKDLQAIASRGAGLVRYLNRFEGIPLEEFDEARARCSDIDSLSDGRFRKLVPSSQDSYLVLDPALARIVDGPDDRG